MPRSSILALVGVALVIAGCGSSKSTSTSSTSTSAASTSTAASATSTPTAYLANFATPSTLGSTVPSNGDINPYGIALVPSSVGKLQRGRVAGQQLQRQGKRKGERSGHRHDDRAGLDRREGLAVCDDRCQDASRPMPGRRRADDGAEHPAGRLRRRGQPADNQRQVGDRQVRLPDRARQRRQGGRDDRQQEHPGSLGLDREERRLQDHAVRQQRAERRCREGHTRSTTRPCCGSSWNPANTRRRRC